MLAINEHYDAVMSDVEIEPGEIGAIQMRVCRHDFDEFIDPIDKRLMSLFDSLDTTAKIFFNNPIQSDREVAEQVIDEPKNPRTRLDAVLIAGQGAKQWTVMQKIRERYPGVPVLSSYQESAVVRGLAQYSEVLDGRRKDLLLLNIANRNVGVQYAAEEESDEGEVLLRFETKHSTNNHWRVIIGSGNTIPIRGWITGFAMGPGSISFVFGEWHSHLGEAEEIVSLNCLLLPGDRELKICIEVEASHALDFAIYDITQGSEKVLLGQTKSI
jgi:hypothetical protein